MKDFNQVERIKIKLNLAKNTDSFLEVFGASHHKYRLDAPIDSEEVEIFEKKYNISLPNEYKIFLTQIGNGGIDYPSSDIGNSGAGPDYGIFKLGNESQFMSDPASGYLEKEPFFHSQMTEEDWKRIYDNLPQEFSQEEYYEEYNRVYAGILGIGSCGCGGYTGILLKGENAGRVLSIDCDIEYCPTLLKEANFLDWYENWLDSIIRGGGIGVTSKSNITEKECFDRYTNADIHGPHLVQYWKIVALQMLRGHDSISPKSLKTLWETYGKETDETVKLFILQLLVKYDYENIQMELNELCQSNALEFLKIVHLYAREKTLQWQNIIQELYNETEDPDVTQYIKYITTHDY